MYGKLINGELVTAPDKTLEYEIDGKHRIICNPQPQHYAEAGYKIVEYGEIPEVQEEQVVSVKYTETDDKILVEYTVKEEVYDD